jgi:protein-tyrosine-phosphatase
VRPSEAVHPLAAAVIDELGGDIAGLRPKPLRAFEENEEGPFELIVSLSPEAHHHALGLIPLLGEVVEYWPTIDPSIAEGSREQALGEFRLVRDELDRRIAARFQRPSTG